MNRHIRKVLVIVNIQKPDAEEMVSAIEGYLGKAGIKVAVFRIKDKPGILEIDDVDLAFALGGDGTVLFSSRILAPKNIPIMAINLGNFGFITEVAKDEWQTAFDKYKNGVLGISERIMLVVNVERNGRRIEGFSGLNDAVICAAGISKIISLKVSLSSTDLGEYRADGIIVSTPTGSTAYSAAAGGPILDPEMEAMILNPICPFTLSNRPVVVQGQEIITVFVKEQQRTGVILTIDGQNVFPLKPGDTVKFRKAEQKALIIRSDKRNFFEVLKKKLNWSGGTDA
ncbi:MAG: NAD(+)/NADH kinase [Spirochaetota bacterium]